MDYVSYINDLLRPNHGPTNPVALDLFAGCGGLALGFEAVGIKTIGYEMDVSAAESYRRNLNSECTTIKLDTDFEYPTAQIIIGGPPCQPFSVGGEQKGMADARDGFPIFLDALRKVRPKVFMFENVRGLLYANKWYFDLILDEIRTLGYLIDFRLLNAVNHGVPQNRERLFVVGHRSSFEFPRSSPRSFSVVDAIGDTMSLSYPDSKFLTASMDAYIAKYEKASSCINPRDLYPDKPARTLTCRNLAGATGDMQRVRLPDGRRRRITVREAARLQSFPDWFEFTGNETSQYNQIGNAVPPLLAYSLATAVKETFFRPEIYSAPEIVQSNFQPNEVLSLF